MSIDTRKLVSLVRRCATGLLATGGLMLGTASQAAPLNLNIQTGVWDVVTQSSNANTISYDFTGSGGTLTVSAATSGFTGQRAGAFGTGPFYFLTSDATNGFNSFNAASTQTTYNLVANFDNSGQFTTGTVEVLGIVDTTINNNTLDVHPDFASCGTCNQGVFYKGSLTEFGFSGTPNGSGKDTVIFEFRVSLTEGDLFDIGWTGGGIKINGDVLWDTNNDGTPDGSYGGAWDPLETNDMAAFLRDFANPAGSAVNIDSFVPVPAAVWLFVSGLLGLAGYGTANGRKKRG